MMLEGKKTRFGLPLNFTLRDAFNHIEAKVGSEVNRVKATLTLKKKISDRTYTNDNENSFLTFMKAMEMDKEDIDILGASSVSYTDLMMYSQDAFRQSLRKDTIRTINNEWGDYISGVPRPHDNRDVWTDFKLFYETAFREKEEDDILTDANKRRAHSATELTEINARLHDLESDTAQMESAFSAMTHNQRDYETPNYMASNPVPKTIGTTSADTVTALTTAMSSPDIKQLFATLMREEISKALPQTTNEVTPPQSRGRTPRAGWDQWKFWCYTHGVNLNHTSANCHKPRPGHKQEATKDNPMGANTKRDHLWMKYCNPITFKIHDQPE